MQSFRINPRFTTAKFALKKLTRDTDLWRVAEKCRAYFAIVNCLGAWITSDGRTDGGTDEQSLSNYDVRPKLF